MGRFGIREIVVSVSTAEIDVGKWEKMLEKQRWKDSVKKTLK